MVIKCAVIYQLLASKNHSIVLWWNSLYILYYQLHSFDGVQRFDVNCNGFTRSSFYVNLHLYQKDCKRFIYL